MRGSRVSNLKIFSLTPAVFTFTFHYGIAEVTEWPG
jgi:hypothetical protein